MVECKKIVDYLLNPPHQCGMSKARFFKDFVLHQGVGEVGGKVARMRRKLAASEAKNQEVVLCNQAALEGAMMLDCMEGEDAHRKSR